MKYSFNRDRKDLVFAYRKDINASFKDLSVVCTAIRYRTVNNALQILDNVINDIKPIQYNRFNKGMGSRHELGGKKGRWPKKCAKIIKNILLSTISNAENKGYDSESMFVIHTAANKTNIVERGPSKGIASISGGYGYSAMRRSDLELAKVEMGLGTMSEPGLSKNMISKLKYFSTKQFKPQKSEKQVHEMEKAESKEKGEKIIDVEKIEKDENKIDVDKRKKVYNQKTKYEPLLKDERKRISH